MVEEHPKSYFTSFVATSISIERHKVTNELIACFAGGSQFEIVIIESDDDEDERINHNYRRDKAVNRKNSKFGKIIKKKVIKP